jgi:hypothetical protein
LRIYRLGTREFALVPIERDELLCVGDELDIARTGCTVLVAVGDWQAFCSKTAATDIQNPILFIGTLPCKGQNP